MLDPGPSPRQRPRLQAPEKPSTRNKGRPGSPLHRGSTLPAILRARGSGLPVRGSIISTRPILVLLIFIFLRLPMNVMDRGLFVRRSNVRHEQPRRNRSPRAVYALPPTVPSATPRSVPCRCYVVCSSRLLVRMTEKSQTTVYLQKSARRSAIHVIPVLRSGATNSETKTDGATVSLDLPRR